MPLKIVQEQPPFVSELGKVFRLPESAVMTVGNILYNPSGNLIDNALMRHEEAHSIRQGNKPDEWWQRYLSDDKFRFGEELLAYKIQYQEAQKHIKDRNALFRYALRLAGDFSGPMYKLPISRSEALKLIRM